ncbi:hypothetical protein AURDEDRAFT_124694 [Auricularia subglabra TFB-10046 SS5]|nr:hypothetical protein AURDEDRAFT_124694 [Auricularia subglabra TFB-10046 SS5]
MRRAGVPEGYVTFVETILTGCRTCLKFDDYTSEWFNVDNGMGQCDPLSNSVPVLQRRHGGGCDFATLHNSPWEFDKTHAVEFATSERGAVLKCSARNIIIRDRTVTNEQSFKFLGVHLDRRLNYKKHAAQVNEKGARYVAQIRRVAHTTKAAKGEHVRRLYVAVALPKMCYAADVWFTPTRDGKNGRRGGSRGSAKRLATVKRAAAILITGAMHTSPGGLLDIHADLWPIRL